MAQIRTHGELVDGGTAFQVTGVKKWITGGMFARYFSTLVKTKQGLTLMVVDRNLGGDNFSTKQILTSYSKAAGTSYVTIDGVRVPRENVVGQEGKGFAYTVCGVSLWSLCFGLALAPFPCCRRLCCVSRVLLS